ncbi:MAG: enoyl-CoA hydratase-related protein [Bacteroidota bacterium]
MDGEPIVATTDGPVALVRLNRPEVLNAINRDLMDRLVVTLEAFDQDATIRCIVLTGNERAFAAGADIKEMADATAVEMLLRDQFAKWDRIKKLRKPVIAAVNGFALGGGCELAMSCDIIIAGDTAQFGQPEISIGVMPGAGGTQRLTRAVGKVKAMEMVLTGRMMTADEALKRGLINVVVPPERVVEESLALAREIASKSPLAIRLAKEAVLKSLETPLLEGLEFERKNFYLLFASADQKEGMRAFLEKRKPVWKGV